MSMRRQLGERAHRVLRSVAYGLTADCWWYKKIGLGRMRRLRPRFSMTILDHSKRGEVFRQRGKMVRMFGYSIPSRFLWKISVDKVQCKSPSTRCITIKPYGQKTSVRSHNYR